ncbi:MAG: hypothetical protein B0W54_14070 [Cellvibrio sp. 79]|nr:MAG: hypothetical protein B0W54_14070 [Cellvibrio sp. 79]
MMMRFLLLLTSCLLALPAWAGDDLLAALGERSRQIQSLHGQFEQQKTIAVLPTPLDSNGRFTVEQGQFVVWELLQPVQQTIRLSPAGITLETDGKAEQIGASMPKNGAETVTRIFMAVISGQWQTLRDHFAIEATGDTGKWQLTLTPRSPALASYIRQITIRGGEFTEYLAIAETNGDNTSIRLVTDKVVRSPQ